MDTPLNFDFVRNDAYVDHKSVLAKMQSRFKNIIFDENDVLNFCMECENEIGDLESMVKFVEIPLSVTDSRALMPCNVFKLLDVYAIPKDNNSRVEYYRNKDGRYIFLPNGSKLRRIYINYVGMPVNKQGTPLIVRAHEMACVYYALYNCLMEPVAEGKINAQMWSMIREEAPLRIAQAAASMRTRDRDHINKMDIIRGNMIPRIGGLSLINTMFK